MPDPHDRRRAPKRARIGAMAVALGLLVGCHGPSHVIPGSDHAETPDREYGARYGYADAGTHALVPIEEGAVSSFGLDVDDASYRHACARMAAGDRPDPAGLRVEEFVNHFDYRVPAVGGGGLHLTVDAAPTPFATDAHVVRFVVQAGAAEVVAPRRTVFAVDASGSMTTQGRLVRARAAVRHLCARMDPTARVTIVAFARDPRVVLEDVQAGDADAIRSALHGIRAYGPSNVLAGLEAAYASAGPTGESSLDARVVLFSDGLANRARWDERSLVRRIISENERGVRLTVVGLGTSSYGDAHLERLARLGAGRYTFLPLEGSLDDALDGLPRPVVAEDVRAQVEFAPETVRSWRQLGYENRAMTAGRYDERGIHGAHLEAGRVVTALYEIRLRPGARGAVASLHLHHRDPVSLEPVRTGLSPLQVDQIAPTFETADEGLRLAACVAEAAELLRGSMHARDGSLEAVRAALEPLPTYGPRGTTDARALVQNAIQLRDRRAR